VRDRVEVSSFEAVTFFRTAVVRFVDAANAALTSADVEITRTIHWLESEQIPYWKKVLRDSAEEIEKLKTAYRDKAFYKDATGARHSAIDELKALRRAEARREEYEQRAAATRRNLRQLQREVTLYKGAASQLRGMVNGMVQASAEELGRVVEQLERYVHIAPEDPRPADLAAAMAREHALFEPPQTTPRELDEGTIAEALRRRTPTAKIRRAAGRADFAPPLPASPALESLAMLPQDGEVPGRYALVTTTLGPDAGGAVYMERLEPMGPSDSGWHIGPADEPGDIGAGAAGKASCVTITAGRVAQQQPELGRLLSLPVGWFLRAEGGRIVVIMDPLGRCVWRPAD
jgi:hypothetical protein